MGDREMAAVVAPRIKREECNRTRHDSQFSKWKVLVGPSDWEDYSLGKEGASRYRIQNLPSVTGPGLYELGIAVSRSSLGRDVEKLGSDGVISVYLGQADNVRTRLQHYGRIGAHLGNNANDRGPNKGPGLFEDVFNRGHAVVFRWVPMKNKSDALKTETELLNRFDYAWNKENNIARRHDDLLRKLDEVSPSMIWYPNFIKKLRYFTQKPVGIKVEARKQSPLENALNTSNDEENHRFFSRISKFNRTQPRLVSNRNEADEEYAAICGVSLGGGSVCIEPPIKGRKRCAQHRGMKTNGLITKLNKEVESDSGIVGSRSSSRLVRKPQGANDLVSDSSAKISSPYELGKVQTQQDLSESSVFIPRHNTICGVELGDGYLCMRQPAKGRIRCENHKGLKINSIIQKSATDDKGPYTSTTGEMKYQNSVCGAITLSGSYCRRVAQGNTRCWQHSVEYFGNREAVRINNGWNYGGNSLCGAPTRGGSYCRRTGKGGGTCWQH